ncbi:glycosyltransferase [Acetobacter sp. LMG 1636]|uniref:Glycosyltransferase n=2 Tax=Acetobacter fallax TaxID=1737473 RepID=A0ABX0KAS6_9PROT|nr:glycosyltransferase family 2 protein [Acetobacter fallax]NHO33534.1 glycosyltransferase [Acetobacter fallax]NHO37123.1 glycosyltransferase [Acetobacter fallax]
MPCYNEEEILPHTLANVAIFFAKCVQDGVIDPDSFVLCVDDGSRDTTWDLVIQAAKADPRVRGTKLSRNTGHQTALVAGLSAVRDCDVIVSIDADLQDDLLVIRDMLAAWRNGYDIVYGVRNERKTDTLFKRETARIFYRLMLLMGVNLVPNHADFRLMDRRALDALLEYGERNLFLRGLVPLIGFPSTSVYYARLERTAGESKYPLSRMIGLAVEGITSLSVTPLRIIALTGILISSFAVLAICYALVGKGTGHTVPGWTSVTIAIFFMGGVQMLSLGIIGEYIGKIYLETKRRPRYHVENATWKNNR